MECKCPGCESRASFESVEFGYCSLYCLETDVHNIIDAYRQDAQALYDALSTPRGRHLPIPELNHTYSEHLDIDADVS